MRIMCGQSVGMALLYQSFRGGGYTFAGSISVPPKILTTLICFTKHNFTRLIPKINTRCLNVGFNNTLLL